MPGVLRHCHPRKNVMATWFCHLHPHEFLIGTDGEKSQFAICRQCLRELFKGGPQPSVNAQRFHSRSLS